MRSKRLPAAAAGLAFALTALTSAAWACTQQGVISLTSPHGAAGSVQRVHGTGFAAQPVQIRWEEEEGQILATAQGPTFDVDVKVPSVAKGFYYVVALQAQDAPHTGLSRAATTFQVDFSITKTTSTAGGQPAELWNGFAQSPAQTGIAADGATQVQKNLSATTVLAAEALVASSMAAFSFIAITLVRKRRAARVLAKDNS